MHIYMAFGIANHLHNLIAELCLSEPANLRWIVGVIKFPFDLESILRGLLNRVCASMLLFWQAAIPQTANEPKRLTR
jgi:hypothetical protein